LGEEVKGEPQEGGKAKIENEYHSIGNVPEDLATDGEMGMLGECPQKTESKCPQCKKGPDHFEDPSRGGTPNTDHGRRV
jgi:hypothetical protein